jgi:TolA-binding protein
MINLDQVKLLETKVAKAAGYVERLVRENTALLQKEVELQARLNSNQARIDELEVLLTRFKEEQSQIEEGILSALEKISQFEKQIEKSLREKPVGFHAAAAKAAAKDTVKPRVARPATANAAEEKTASDDGRTCFEISEETNGDDVPDPLQSTEVKPGPVAPGGVPANTDTASAEGKELDIF